MCGLMHPTVCESVQDQDTLPGRRSLGEVGVGDSEREEDGKELKATSAVLTASMTFIQMPCRIKKWSLMTSASSITKLVQTFAKGSRGPSRRSGA